MRFCKADLSLLPSHPRAGVPDDHRGRLSASAAPPGTIQRAQKSSYANSLQRVIVRVSALGFCCRLRLALHHQARGVIFVDSLQRSFTPSTCAHHERVPQECGPKESELCEKTLPLALLAEARQFRTRQGTSRLRVAKRASRALAGLGWPRLLLGLELAQPVPPQTRLTRRRARLPFRRCCGPAARDRRRSPRTTSNIC
jgi:hypothetical protein